MIFTETSIPGVWIVDPQRHEDDRGFFARTWCQHEFERHGLNPQIVQCSVSFNKKRGILRGMHYQAAPHEETKLIRCTMGSIYDVAIDLRAGSRTFKRHVGVVLDARNRRMLYVPEGCAHGFQALEDATEVSYLMSRVYVPQSARGVRWNDPAFGIDWPIGEPTMLERDRLYADFTVAAPSSTT